MKNIIYYRRRNLPTDQRTSKFTYSPLGIAFEKQIKTIEDWGKKRIKALEHETQLVKSSCEKESLIILKQKNNFWRTC